MQSSFRNGPNGQNGRNGRNGRNGKDGTNGKDGINGTNGKDGKDGINGTNGKDGKDGKDGGNSEGRNWKECAWNNINDPKDNGVIKVSADFFSNNKLYCFLHFRANYNNCCTSNNEKIFTNQKRQY